MTRVSLAHVLWTAASFWVCHERVTITYRRQLHWVGYYFEVLLG